MKFILHIGSCQECLAKVRQLHEIVDRITRRADSGIVTVYRIAEHTKENPITAAPTIDFVSACKRKISEANLRPLFRVAISSAAVILIVSALFLFNTPSAGAVTLKEIYKAVERIKNVYIARFDTEKNEILQEKWISRKLNIYMTKTKGKTVLWDLDSGNRKITDVASHIVIESELTDNQTEKINKKLGGSLGLMPFYDLSLVPENAQWNRITNEIPETVAGNIEIYELTWTDKTLDGSIVFCKWRGFLDTKTNLPQEVELHEKVAGESEYTLMYHATVEYLSDSEMEMVLGESSL